MASAGIPLTNPLLSTDPVESFIAMNASLNALETQGTRLGRLYNFMGLFDERQAQYYTEDNDSFKSSCDSGEESDRDDGWGIPESQIEQASALGGSLRILRRNFVHSVGGAVRTTPGERLALVIGGRTLPLCDGALLAAADVLPHCTPAGFGDLVPVQLSWTRLYGAHQNAAPQRSSSCSCRKM